MTHGLFAPQFGLMARSDQHANEADAAARRNAVEALFLPQAGPTVVVRRRRLIDADGGTASEVVSEDTVAAGLPAAKTPKVYRLQSPKATDPALEAHARASTAETAPTAVMPRRRPRNALRAPTLLSHIVFEQPERNVEPAMTLTGVAPELNDDPRPGDDASSYEAVCLALARVRDELDVALQARRFGLMATAETR